VSVPFRELKFFLQKLHLGENYCETAFNMMPAKLKTFKLHRAAGCAALLFASAIVINACADAGFNVGFDFHKIISLILLKVISLLFRQTFLNR